MKKISETYKKHEFGIEAPEGYLLESSADYLEELNDLLKELDEARSRAATWRQRYYMCTPWSICEKDKKFPWEK